MQHRQRRAVSREKMKYTISPSDNNKFLIMKAMGDFTIEIARQWSIELSETGRKMNIKRFLFDVRMARNACSILENYNHAYKDPDNLHLLTDIRSAILVSEGDQSHNFIETTFLNAGFNIKIFTDESVAVKWLEESAN